MTLLFKKILLLSAPLLAFLFFAEVRLRTITTQFEKKKVEFEEKIPAVDLLILGNSHGENAIVPTLLSDSGYNLSLPSQSLFYNEKLLEKYLPKMKKLKQVIITVDYHSFYFVDQELSAFNNDKFFGVSKKYYDYRFTSENLSFFFFVYGALPSLNYLMYKPKLPVPERGFEPLPGADSSVINAHNGSVRASSHNALAVKDKKLKSLLLQSLVKMIDLLKKQNIQVMLVSTPVFHTYYDDLNSDVLRNNKQVLDSISSTYDVPYFNFMQLPELEMADFSDNDHLSQSGAIKFTTLLGKLIRR